MGKTTIKLGEWTEHGRRYRLAVNLELRVGDLGGDLASRGFQTIYHEPCPPGVLNLSVTHDVDSRSERGGAWIDDSGGAGLPVEHLRAIDDGGTWDVDRATAYRLAEIADRWHLNTMRAACAHQTAVPVGATITFPTFAGPLDLFTVERYAPSRHAWVDAEGVEMAHKDLPDHTCGECGHSKKIGTFATIYDACDHYGANRGQVCAESGYKYGSAWLVEVLPAGVVAELAGFGCHPPTRD